MNEQKTITAAEITPEFIEEQATEIKGLAQRAKKAADAYMADLNQRKAALEEQATGYREQIEANKKQRKVLAAKINDLSSRGMIDEAAEADAKVEALDKTISVLERKLKLINIAELKGDPKLYKVAKDASAAVEAAGSGYRHHMVDLRGTVRAEIERLEKMEKELLFASQGNPGWYAVQAFEKVDRHYRELDRIARETKEKAAAERAAETNKPFVQHIV